jgi:baseplate J-like protein
VSAENAAAQSALAYRPGDHASFKAAMLADAAAMPALGRLTTRADDDPTVALLDASAAVLDVLAFYQERIANEGFLRTATERGSVLELTRAIGYEPGAGVAAGTWLAFSTEEADGSPDQVVLPAGTRAQSVPGEGELPQIFETTAEIEARPEWNALRARTTEAATPKAGTTELFLQGTATGLKSGDLVALVGSRPPFDEREIRRVVRVAPVDADPLGVGPPAHTVVTIDRALQKPPEDLVALTAFRRRAALFGHSAMPWVDLALPLRVGELHPKDGGFITGPYADRQKSWADAPFAKGTTTLWLDQVHDGIVAGGWIVLAGPENTELFAVKAVAEDVRNDFLLSGAATRLEIEGEGIERFSPKNAVAWVQSSALPLAQRPRTAAVTGTRIELETAADVEPGRLVAVSGDDAVSGAPIAEVRTVQASAGTAVTLTPALANRYAPLSVRVNANVAPATHGQAWSEILGDGDGRVPYQAFTLSNRPLTYVPAPTPSGGASTLEVRVDGVRWDEVPHHHGQPQDARVYTARHAEDGTVTVRFGATARPPTGQANVSAAYRVGIGAAANVAAGAISVPLTRPLGLRGVLNPVGAGGGTDPESRDEARRNAPLTVLAMGRIVSLRDYQDFARAFQGIAKARATATWSGERRLVRLVVAATGGAPLDASGTLAANLRAAIDAARHPDQPVEVADHVARAAAVRARVRVDERLIAADVLASAVTALAEAFGFDARDLGQGLSRTEVLAALHAVPGVLGAVLDEAGDVAAAPDELLTLAAADIALEEWAP